MCMYVVHKDGSISVSMDATQWIDDRRDGGRDGRQKESYILNPLLLICNSETSLAQKREKKGGLIKK